MWDLGPLQVHKITFQSDKIYMLSSKCLLQKLKNNENKYWFVHKHNALIYNFHSFQVQVLEVFLSGRTDKKRLTRR